MKFKRGHTTNHDNPGENGLVKAIVSMVDQYIVPSRITSGQAWNRLEKQLSPADHPGNRVMNMSGSRVPSTVHNIYMRIAAVAAILCVVLTGYLMFYHFSSTITGTGYGENLFVYLPDGSGVTLNAGSSIEYRKAGWKRDRTVSLKGEAFFEVTKGSQFTVSTDGFETRVLGTSFNIFARGKDFRVNCSSGRIKIITDSGQETIMETGDYLVGINGSITGLYTEKHTPANTWMDGEFYYHNEPLANVLAEIERQFNITIDYSGTKNRNYSGYFHNKDLNMALELVCIPMQLDYKFIDDRQVLVY
jgi:transmembrane sensor